MKKQIFKVGGGASVIILMLAAFAQVWVSAKGQSGNDQGLVGSWDVQVSIVDCESGTVFVSFPVMRTYNLGGTMQDAGGDSSDALNKAGHGVWRRLSWRTYSHSFRSFRFNANGTLAGTTKIVGNVKVGNGGDTFTANTTFQVLDTAGNILFAGCGS